MTGHITERYINEISGICERIKPMVAVRCITYNHEPYLRQTLEGFVSQITDFPFVVIVHDDASKDKTAEIIREFSGKYPDMILPIFEEENQYSKRDGTIRRIMDEAVMASGAKYVAICEGDDFWIDPHKLQKQVDFLESHPDYGLCCTGCFKFEDGKKEDFNLTTLEDITIEDELLKNQVATLTVLFRAHFLKDYREMKIEQYRFPMGDYPLWLYIASKSKIKSLTDKTACYRILPESASHSTNLYKRFLFLLAYFEIQILYGDRYPKLKRKSRINRIKLILKSAIRQKDPVLLKHLFRYYYL